MRSVKLGAMFLFLAAVMSGQADTPRSDYVKQYPKGSVDSWQWIKPGIGTVKADMARYIGNSVWKLQNATIDNGTTVITAEEIDFNTDTFQGATHGQVRVNLRTQVSTPK